MVFLQAGYYTVSMLDNFKSLKENVFFVCAAGLYVIISQFLQQFT